MFGISIWKGKEKLIIIISATELKQEMFYSEMKAFRHWDSWRCTASPVWQGPKDRALGDKVNILNVEYFDILHSTISQLFSEIQRPCNKN